MTAADDRKPGGTAFQDTRWSVVIRARDGDPHRAGAALAELCQAYWYPLYVFVRRRGSRHHEAEDMTQGFFCHLIERHGLAHVDPGKGRFRSFLLSSLAHYLSNERDRAQALKRGGGQPPLPLDCAGGDDRYRREPVDDVTPEVAYERAWALTLLDDTMKRLRQEYVARGKEAIFSALQTHLGGSGSDESYADVAGALGVSEGNLKVLVHRLRRRFGEVLRERVADTVQAETEIDEEIRHLMSCFSRPSPLGRLSDGSV